MISFVFDCDGVLYLDEEPLPGARETLEALAGTGHQLLFATNNATRTARDIAAKIARVVGYPATEDQVVGSAMAAAEFIGTDGGPVLVVGEDGLLQTVRAAGIEVTTDWRTAASVVVGLDRNVNYEKISDAARAVRGGARFVAANNDPTYPTPNGLVPGAGTIVAAIATASGVEPDVAGKPFEPMVALVRQRARFDDVWVLGDRPETDLALAAAGGWKGFLVMTGVTDDAEKVPDWLQPHSVLASVAEVLEMVSGAQERSAG